MGASATQGWRLLVDGHDVGPVLVADTASARLRGMLLRRPLPPALLLVPGNSVHGVGMVQVLEVALLDASLQVRRVCRLRPFGMTRPRRDIASVLEAPVGSFARWGLVPGSQLAVEPGGAA